MAAWRHYKRWTEAIYNQYRAYVAKAAPKLFGPHKTASGQDLDCADLSIGLLIEFAAANGLPVNFWDVSGFLYASMALCPFGPNGLARPSQLFLNQDRFTFIVRVNIQTKSLWNLNTDVDPDGPAPGDLLMRYSQTPFGYTDNHHTALIFAAYAPGVAHPDERENVPSFPGPDEAMRQVRVTEYFMGTVDDSGATMSRSPDTQSHFDYLNSRGDAKRNAELIYYANAMQFQKAGFEFRKYSDVVLWDWPAWDGQGRPPALGKGWLEAPTIPPPVHRRTERRPRKTGFGED